ncbi:MAG TPA: type II toxin-antitoxin system VapC family toxin [Chloroflexota bacterium]|nr:type II toxin-antitoxin system VapC family toxin [Chloroflexota bacterium]
MRLLDANIFLRALVVPESEADHVRAQAAAALFERLGKGEEEATTIEAIITEVCYVLRSRAHYALSPAEVAARLRPLLMLRGLKLPHKRTYLQALDLWVAFPTLDFEDVLLLAHAERLGLDAITSYDTDFDHLPGIARTQPESVELP